MNHWREPWSFCSTPDRTGHRSPTPCYFPDGAVGLIYRGLARFHISDEEALTVGLARLGYRPADVTAAVISHLHQDHIGGVRQIPDANLLVSAEEWRSLGRWPTHAGCSATTSTCPLFGDRSLVLLPTPGHTRRSMSMLVRRNDAPPLLLAGDLTYGIHAFERGRTGGVGSRRRLHTRSGGKPQVRWAANRK